MVPSAFVVLDALPLSPNGKVDRGALPPPEHGRPSLSTAYRAPATTLEHALVEVFGDILGVEDVGVDDSFFDLGGDSLQAALLINRLQERLGQVLYVVAIFDAPSVATLALYLAENYSDVEVRLGGPAAGPPLESEAARASASASAKTIDEVAVARFKNLILPLAPSAPRPAVPKNPPAIFVLAPPRSGTTLLRVLLGGHQRLFAPPELYLLGFDTLAERKEACTERQRFMLEGSVRALMALRGWDLEQALRAMEEYEGRDLTTQEFYRLLQGSMGDRILVDKTPTYGLDLHTLRRAEEVFTAPYYIHLVRHPVGMIRSFEEARIDRILQFAGSFQPRELGELIWLVTHRNIRDFLSEIPASRHLQVGFEDLVKRPGPVMEGVCRFLGLDFDAEMLEPYKDKERRMTDGLHPLSRGIMDVKFHEHRGIDAEMANRSLVRGPDPAIGALAWALAEALGCEAARPRNEAPAISPGSDLASIRPMSAARDAKELLKRLDQLSEVEIDDLLASRSVGGQGR